MPPEYGSESSKEGCLMKEPKKIVVIWLKLEQKQIIDQVFLYNSLCKAENCPDELKTPQNALQFCVMSFPIYKTTENLCSCQISNIYEKCYPLS